jgi:hypothetical protein
MDYLVIHDPRVRVLFGAVLKGRGSNLLLLLLDKGERGSREKCK